MNAFKERCVSLRLQGLTLPEIAHVTGRSKTSIYFHIRSLPLSREKKEAIREARSIQAKAMARARKGKSLRGFNEFTLWSPQNVLLVAHMSFDGEAIRGKCTYNNRNDALVLRVISLMNDIYAFEPSHYINRKTRVRRISYHNVALGEFFRKKSTELLDTVRDMTTAHKREFLRAFFDDEGCVDFRPDSNKRRVRGYQKDVRILSLVQSLLADINISSRLIAPNEVVISGKSELLKFQKEINFSAGVCINGNRSNSIWKEHLEKRDLLERAILSFKV